MIITIINQKGGVGKTTTALNLGAALTLQGHRITFVDLDTQRDLLSFKGAIKGSKWQTALPAKPGGLTIIDCPPRIEGQVEDALKMATVVLVPMQPNALSVRGVARMNRDLPEYSDAPLKYLLTMAAARHRQHKIDARAALGESLCKTIIPRSTAVEDSTNEMQTVFSYAPESPGARAYMKLAKEVETW